MRLNDFGLLAIVLLAGLLVGVVGTLGVYSSVASHQAEDEQKRSRGDDQELEEERDQLQAQINDYAEAERDQQLVVEQPGAEEPRAAPVAPKRPAVAAAPRPDTGSRASARRCRRRARRRTSAKAKPAPDPAAGFGPPREYGNK